MQIFLHVFFKNFVDRFGPVWIFLKLFFENFVDRLQNSHQTGLSKKYLS